MRMTDTANLATRFFDRLGTGDIDGVLALTSPDFTWTVMAKEGRFAMAGTYDRGRFVEMLGRVGETFQEGPTMDVTSVTEGSKRIVVEARVRGESHGGVAHD